MTIRILNFADGFSSASRPTDILGSYQVYPLELIDASGEISSEGQIGFQKRVVAGDAAAVTTSLTPFGNSGWDNGTVITLYGSDAVNTVTIPFNDNDYGCCINGQMVLGDSQSITLQWDEPKLRWLEIGRNI
jgi:hypothetical protein